MTEDFTDPNSIEVFAFHLDGETPVNIRKVFFVVSEAESSEQDITQTNSFDKLSYKPFMIVAKLEIQTDEVLSQEISVFISEEERIDDSTAFDFDAWSLVTSSCKNLAITSTQVYQLRMDFTISMNFDFRGNEKECMFFIQFQ